MSKFFIDDAIVAMVISIVLVLGGGLTILRLPVAQFPRSLHLKSRSSPPMSAPTRKP